MSGREAARGGWTPGPWRVSEENCGGGANVCAESRRVAYTGEHRDKSGAVILTDEAHANARLIAAAPALVEALAEAVEALEAARCGAMPGMGAIDNARAALAAARGEAKP